MESTWNWKIWLQIPVLWFTRINYYLTFLGLCLPWYKMGLIKLCRWWGLVFQPSNLLNPQRRLLHSSISSQWDKVRWFGHCVSNKEWGALCPALCVFMDVLLTSSISSSVKWKWVERGEGWSCLVKLWSSFSFYLLMPYSPWDIERNIWSLIYPINVYWAPPLYQALA